MKPGAISPLFSRFSVPVALLSFLLPARSDPLYLPPAGYGASPLYTSSPGPVFAFGALPDGTLFLAEGTAVAVGSGVAVAVVVAVGSAVALAVAVGSLVAVALMVAVGSMVAVAVALAVAVA